MIMKNKRGRPPKLIKANSGIVPKKFKPRRKFGERALNKQLLRIHLPREDLTILQERITSSSNKTTNSSKKITNSSKKITSSSKKIPISSVLDKTPIKSKRTIIKKDLNFPPTPKAEIPKSWQVTPIETTPKVQSPKAELPKITPKTNKIIPEPIPKLKPLKAETPKSIPKPNKVIAKEPTPKVQVPKTEIPKSLPKAIKAAPKEIQKAVKLQSPKPFRITLTPKLKAKPAAETRETMNGTAFFPDTKVIKTYYIKFPAPPKHLDGKLQFKFTQLVNDVKTMQLPTPSWKIKVIIKTQKISAVVFTNKAEIERSVTFTADRDTYDIVFDNRPAVLLGSPDQVVSSKEIEVMLQVLERLESDSPMVSYK